MYVFYIYRYVYIYLYMYIYAQTNPRDTVGSVPDLNNKVNIAVKQVTGTFWFPSVYTSYVYTILRSIKCAIALCLRNNVHTLI